MTTPTHLRGVSSLRSHSTWSAPTSLLGGIHLRMARPASLLSAKSQNVPRLTSPFARGHLVADPSLFHFRPRHYSTAPASSASSRPDQLLPGSASAIKDPSHPHLYYHPLSHASPSPFPSPTSPSSSPSSPARLALSFLPEAPAPGSRTVIGWIPANGGGLDDFKENHAFREVLQSAVKQSLERRLADTVIFEASTRPGDGYIHITDERAIPPAGRIGETEDLIGSVFVENGEVVPSTYEPQPSYRLITQHGPPILPKGIDEHLLHVLRSISAKENGDAPGGDETS